MLAHAPRQPGSWLTWDVSQKEITIAREKFDERSYSIPEQSKPIADLRRQPKKLDVKIIGRWFEAKPKVSQKEEIDFERSWKNKMKTRQTEYFIAGRRGECQAANVFKRAANQAPQRNAYDRPFSVCLGSPVRRG